MYVPGQGQWAVSLFVEIIVELHGEAPGAGAGVACFVAASEQRIKITMARIALVYMFS